MKAQQNFNNYKILKLFSGIILSAGLFAGGVYFFHPFAINSASATSSIITTSYSNDGEYVSTPAVSGNIDLDLTGTSSGAYTGGSHTVSVDTNVDTYALYVSTTNTDSAMVNATSNTYTIPATSGTASSAAAMGTNTWGYALDSFNPGNNAQTAYTYDTLAKGNGSTDQWNSSLWAKVPYVANADTDVSDADQIFEHISSMPQNNNSTDVTSVGPATLDEAESAGYTMQQITQDMCANTRTYEETNKTYTLKDSRDDNEYKIRKLADGNCWMVQNLHLINKTISSADSNTSSSFTIPASATPVNELCDDVSADCADRPLVLYINTIYGIHYNWYTTVASSGDWSTKGTEAPFSICPRSADGYISTISWHLPSRNEHYNLFSVYKDTYGWTTIQGNGNDTTKMFDASVGPSFIASGFSSTYGAGFGTGTYGQWWASTASQGNASTAFLAGAGSGGSYVDAAQYSNYLSKSRGAAIRCVLSSE